MYALFMTVIGALALVAVISLSRGKAAKRRDSAGSSLYTGFDGSIHHHHHGGFTGGHHGGHDGGGFSGGGHHG
jgi:hypothetical protein